MELYLIWPKKVYGAIVYGEQYVEFFWDFIVEVERLDR